MDAIVHDTGWCGQPDIQIYCTGRFTIAGWDSHTDHEGVFRTDDDQLYTFTPSLITCDDCKRKREDSQKKVKVMPEEQDPQAEARVIETLAAHVRQAARDRARAEGSHCDDIEAILAALELARAIASYNDNLDLIDEAKAAALRLNRHIDASAKIALEQSREIERLRAEILDFAEALEQAGGSGETCPKCHGNGWVLDRVAAKAAHYFIDGSRLIRGQTTMICPRCSVPAGELAECRECGGTGAISNSQCIRHHEYECDCAVPVRPLVSCPTCQGRGKVRSSVALGVVYDGGE